MVRNVCEARLERPVGAAPSVLSMAGVEGGATAAEPKRMARGDSTKIDAAFAGMHYAARVLVLKVLSLAEDARVVPDDLLLFREVSLHHGTYDYNYILKVKLIF